MSGYEVFETSDVIGSGQSISFLLACPPGKRALGGGVDAPFGADIGADLPTANGTSWFVLGSTGLFGGTVTARVACASV